MMVGGAVTIETASVDSFDGYSSPSIIEYAASELIHSGLNNN